MKNKYYIFWFIKTDRTTHHAVFLAKTKLGAWSQFEEYIRENVGPCLKGEGLEPSKAD